LGLKFENFIAGVMKLLFSAFGAYVLSNLLVIVIISNIACAHIDLFWLVA